MLVTRELGVEPATLGTILAVSSLAAPAGALLAPRLSRRFGLGPAMIGSLLAFSAAHLPVPFAAGPPLLVVVLLLAARAVVAFSVPIFDVTSTTLRLAVTPDSLRGRVGATARFIFHGPVPIGALLGGALADAIGLRLAYRLAVGGQFLAVLWLLGSPVRRVRESPLRVTAGTRYPTGSAR